MIPKAKITQAELDRLLAALEVAEEERRTVTSVAAKYTEKCGRLGAKVHKLEAELAPLREFYKMAAKVECQGKCGKFIPVMEDTEFGSRLRHGEWLCTPCHSNVCGVDVSKDENHFHNCQALRD